MSYQTVVHGGAVATQGRDGLLRKVLLTVHGLYRRSVDRKHLLDLDDRLLADIGLSRADVEREAGKPFWKA